MTEVQIQRFPGAYTLWARGALRRRPIYGGVTHHWRLRRPAGPYPTCHTPDPPPLWSDHYSIYLNHCVDDMGDGVMNLPETSAALPVLISMVHGRSAMPYRAWRLTRAPCIL